MANSKNNNKNNSEAKITAPDTVTLKKEEYDRLMEESKKCSEYLNDLKRLQADFENAKKRLEKDRQDYVKYAKEEVLAELLGIFDNFKRADDAAAKTKDFGLLHQGVMMILKDFSALLEDSGVKEIPAIGEVFDPLKHEAVGYEIRNDIPENTVVEELQKGYSINGKIIRHSVVKVSKKEDDKEQLTEDREEETENR